MNDLVQNPKGAGNAGASSEAKIDSVDQIEAILSRTLFNPIHDMAEHPSQHSSIEFVQAGFYLSSPGSQTTLTNADAALCANLAGVLETIHSGLIIIDDIQNDCAERKGIASFHKAHGLPVALNAGNWLHFQPFESIESLGLPPDKELLLYRACHEAMLKVHLGQALDLGAHLDQTKQSEVSAICMASLRLKAGALTSLARQLK
jgi:geranylgeranyl pyrophosphate synthase